MNENHYCVEGSNLNEDREKLRAQTIVIRDRYLHGDITFEQAKKELGPFIETYNRLAEKIAAKYSQKPIKLRVGEFLRVGFHK